MSETNNKKSTSGSEKVDEIVKEKTTTKKTNSSPKKSKVVKSKMTTTKKESGELKNADISTKNEKKHLTKEERFEERKEARIKREKANAKKREEIAKLKQEQKDLREKARHMTKEEREQARIVQKEKLDAKKAKAREDRLARHKKAVEAKADRLRREQEKRENSKRVRDEKREERKNRNKDRNGQQNLGFWITAVSVLGLATLIMTTLFTVGNLQNSGLQDIVGSQYTSTMYELTGLTDNIDSNLSKLRVTNTGSIQEEILTDVLIQSELCMATIEKLPVDLKYTQSVTAFTNNMAEQARQLLAKLKSGEKLTNEELEIVEYMYTTNQKIKKELNELSNSINDDDISDVVRARGDSKTYSSFDRLQNSTISNPSTIAEGPFSQTVKNVTLKGLENQSDISLDSASGKCNEYFSKYNITSINYLGEVTGENITCYNFELMDNKNRSIYAQISKQGGKLVMFDLYEECHAVNYDGNACIQIAKEYLSTLGINDMQEVWINESDSVCTVSFAYEDNGVIIYSDMVKVKICQTKGVVVGLEALPYYLNHSNRELQNPTITMDEAKNILSSKLLCNGTKTCLIPVNNKECLAYEFACQYNDKTYFIYVDALTGEEIEIFEVIDSKQGQSLL